MDQKKTEDKVKFWSEHISAQEKSTQNIAKYCESQFLNKHTFQYWRRRLRPKSTSPSNQFLSVQVKDELSVKLKSSKIHLPNGVIVEVGTDLVRKEVSHFILRLCGVNNAEH